jgi:hypothetical protein
MAYTPGVRMVVDNSPVPEVEVAIHTGQSVFFSFFWVLGIMQFTHLIGFYQQLLNQSDRDGYGKLMPL